MHSASAGCLGGSLDGSLVHATCHDYSKEKPVFYSLHGGMEGLVPLFGSIIEFVDAKFFRGVSEGAYWEKATLGRAFRYIP